MSATHCATRLRLIVKDKDKIDEKKQLRKIMPNALDLIMTPFVVMLVTFLIVILGIGPVMHVIELGIVDIVESWYICLWGSGDSSSERHIRCWSSQVCITHTR